MNMFSVLVTSTSFQDQKGEHLRRINSEPRLHVDFARGPLNKDKLKAYIGKYDAILCGDDEYDHEFFELNKGKLKVVSKYGVGLDKIDLKAAKTFGISVFSCAGINSKSVAEHVFALLLCSAKNMEDSIKSVRSYKWDRAIGNDIKNNNFLLIGYGNIGKEVSRKAIAFDMNVGVFDPYIKEKNSFTHFTDLAAAYQWADIVSLHCPLNSETQGIINNKLLKTKKNTLLINTARGGLVNEADIELALKEGNLKAYLADVLQNEPITAHCSLAKLKNALITPHIASRTTENIIAQAKMALENLYKGLNLG